MPPGLSRLFLAMVITLSSLGGGTAQETLPVRPNVILIVADDLGSQDLGCYGSQFHQTPELDRLAAEGIRFRQAYSAAPVCSPTRAALLTGRHPARLHITDWLPGRPDHADRPLKRPSLKMELPLEEVTLAELFRNAGYATAHIGKWHLGGTGFGPLEQGFDRNIAGTANGSPPGYFAPYRNSLSGLNESVKGESLTDRLELEAERFIEQSRKQPFFLSLCHFAVHTPLEDSAAEIGTFPPEAPFTGQQNNPVYAAMLKRLDASIGRLRAKLTELNLAEQTVIVFTSDNGGLATVEGPHTPATSNAPFREGKGWLYEGGIRVPLIIAGAKVKEPGRTTDQVTQSCDLVPTLCELCQLGTPPQGDGVSLATWLNDPTANVPRTLYWHYPHDSNQGGRPGGAIRDGNWKLIEYFESGRTELFDVAKDPSESRNLFLEEPEVAARLTSELSRWRDDIHAQMPTPNPAYRPNPQKSDGQIVLPARTAQVTGVMLRYEPLPHKNTLGFWVRREDTAWWEFEVLQPGTFRVEAFVGCGTGSGGSEVEFRFAHRVLSLTVPETGGFQQFRPLELGTVTLSSAGRHRLEIHARSKPGVAVMDLREVTLTPLP